VEPEPAPVAPQYGYTPSVTTPASSFGYTEPDPRFGYSAPDPRFGPAVPAAPAATGWVQPVASHYLANPAGDLSAGKNTPARVALVVSILAMLGTPLAAVAGIVLAIVGLKRARTLEAAGWAPKGRTKARWALGLSIVGLAVSVVVTMFAVRNVLNDALRYDSQAVETQIADAVATQTGVTLTVSCPEQVDTTVGSTFQCTAIDPEGTQMPVTVQFTDTTGSWTWQIG
jgi:hypothetical protein